MAEHSPISILPDVLSGTAVFRGTRVPVQAFCDYLEAGNPLDEFLDDFPTVTREQAIQVLEYSSSLMLTATGACAPG